MSGEPLDPVEAYDRIAPSYARLSDERRAYLEAVERLVIAGVPRGSGSLLDVGAGEGSRAMRIAQAAGITEVTLLEPSAGMRAGCIAHVRMWAMRAEDLAAQAGEFSAITCLWNVLGHIFPASARVEVVRQFARLVAAQGRIFIDVNHRYNARHYGAWKTAARVLRDLGSAPGAHGDVTVQWGDCVTKGHVFTHREFARLARQAGLTIERRYTIDYASGEVLRCACAGHLMYVLKRRYIHPATGTHMQFPHPSSD
jgi:2-polyprenyl-3-methyl-5-hydroxy-6-metoxy-1,4-benzoquinol methylase